LCKHPQGKVDIHRYGIKIKINERAMIALCVSPETP